MDPPVDPFRLHGDYEAMLPPVQTWDDLMATSQEVIDPSLLVQEPSWSQFSSNFSSSPSNSSSEDHLFSQRTRSYGPEEHLEHARHDNRQGSHMPESSHNHQLLARDSYQPYGIQHPVSNQMSAPQPPYFTNGYMSPSELLDGFGSQFSSQTTTIMGSEQEELNEADLTLVTVLNAANNDTHTSIRLPTAFGQQTHIGLNFDGTDPNWSPHDQRHVGGDADLGFVVFHGSIEHGGIPRCSSGEMATVSTAGTDVTEHVPSAAISPQPSRLGQATSSQVPAKRPSKAARGPRPRGSATRPDSAETPVTAGGHRWVEKTKSKYEVLNKLLPKFNEAVRMVKDRNDVMPPPPSTPGPNGLYFANANAAAKANKIVYWEPLQNDHSIPTSRGQVEDCVRMLVAAIKNNKGCVKSNEDNDSIAWSNRWADGATYFAANIPESVAWKIVDLAIKIHQKGWSEATADPKLRHDIYYTMRLSFQERLDLIKKVLTLAKDTCGDLIKGKRFHEVVGSPQVVYQRIHCNKQSNKDKKTLIAKGKEAEGKSSEQGEGKSTVSKRKRKEDDDSVAYTKRRKQQQPSVVPSNDTDAKHGNASTEVHAGPALAGPSTLQGKPNNSSRGKFTTKIVPIKPKPNGKAAAATLEDKAGDGFTGPHKAPKAMSESNPAASKEKAREGDKSASPSTLPKSTGTASKRKPKPVVTDSKDEGEDEGEDDLQLRSSRGKANQSRVRSAVTGDAGKASIPTGRSPHTPSTVPDRSATGMYPADKLTRPVPARR
ncbi:hypothetical protein E8E13_002394 [Curvularia kusanoi]|uniref:Uncharacterized protein n=1 Tax=Curvularia kusanoi TaxID=90978 RepID=A0A9P4W6X2_CURKU|nr:hypothetical protein E8E13_002394 [Curvularia kusanoi]